MRGQRSAEPDGRHRADCAAEKSMRVYRIFSIDGARGVYMKRASGETVNFSGARLNAAYFMRLGEMPRRSL